MKFCRVLIAAKACVQFCVPLMDNMAAVCATARRVGKALSATYRLVTAKFLIAISMVSALGDLASVIPAGRALSATNVS